MLRAQLSQMTTEKVRIVQTRLLQQQPLLHQRLRQARGHEVMHAAVNLRASGGQAEDKNRGGGAALGGKGGLGLGFRV